MSRRDGLQLKRKWGDGAEGILSRRTSEGTTARTGRGIAGGDVGCTGSMFIINTNGSQRRLRE
jgi:hypothetical protein